ncbi:hypothetical protein ACPYO6_14975 [Georgenia sp. Z1344]|uniref:hypothetical protein n=1 Tax=Georgenia sp. Z1344 TaxID=3416706 RepID=UPI003CEF89D2
MEATVETALRLLLLRMALGALLAGRAGQKLFGWFHGRGNPGTAPLFEADGVRPGALMVTIAGLSELEAATLSQKRLWAHLGGYEVRLAYALIALVLAVTVPGECSIDDLLPWGPFHGPLWAVAALGLDLATAAPLVAMVARHRRATSA